MNKFLQYARRGGFAANRRGMAARAAVRRALNAAA